MFRRPSFNRRHRIAQNSSPYRRNRLPSCPSGASTLSPPPHPIRVPADDRSDVIPKRILRDFLKHNPAQQVPNTDNEESEPDDSIFHWDEEATLLADLMEEEPALPDNDDLDKLAESLQDPFSVKGKSMKREIAQTLVKTHNHVMVNYQLLDKTVDPLFGGGVSLFNKACKAIEQTVQREQVDFESAYKATQEKIQALFEELESEYLARDKLWAAAQKSMDDIVTSAIQRVTDTPARVERTIVRLEKQDKSLGNTPADVETVSKTLQQLLKST